MVKIYKKYWIYLVTILGFIIRIYGLGKETVWYDEIASIDQATRDLPNLFFRFHLSPLYFFLLRYWIRLFGVSAFSLRFLSSIFGSGSIFLSYKIGKMLFNEKVGLISSIILALSPFHLFYSQETRHYALLVFLTLLSMFFFLKIIKDNFVAPLFLYIQYVVVTILLMYTSLLSIFVLLIQNIFFFLFFKEIKERKRWINAQVIIFLFFLFWLIPFLIYLFEEKEYVSVCLDWIPRPQFLSLLEVIRTFIHGGSRYGGGDFKIDLKEIGIFLYPLYIVSILFFSLGMIPYRKGDHSKIIFLNLWLFIPVIIVYIFSHFSFSLFLIRYFLFVSPAYYILMAKGIDRIRSPNYQIIIVSIFTLLIFPSLYIYYNKDLKMRWERAIDYLERNKDKNDIVIISPSRLVQMFGYYGIDGITNKPKSAQFKIDIIKALGFKMLKGGFAYNTGQHKLIGVNNIEQLQDIIDRGIIKENNGVWLILNRWTKNKAEFIFFMKRSYRIKSIKHYTGLSILCYTHNK